MHEPMTMDGVRVGSAEGRALSLMRNHRPEAGSGTRGEPRDSYGMSVSPAGLVPREWGNLAPSPAVQEARAPEEEAQAVELRGGAAAGPLGKEEARALKERQREADAMRAAEIRATMETDRRLADERIRALWADLQTEVFRIWEEVLLRRQKTMNDLFEKWCKVLTE